MGCNKSKPKRKSGTYIREEKRPQTMQHSALRILKRGKLNLTVAEEKK